MIIDVEEDTQRPKKRLIDVTENDISMSMCELKWCYWLKFNYKFTCLVDDDPFLYDPSYVHGPESDFAFFFFHDHDLYL